MFLLFGKWYEYLFQVSHVPTTLRGKDYYIHMYQGIYTCTKEYTHVPRNKHMYQGIYTCTKEYTHVPRNIHMY